MALDLEESPPRAAADFPAGAVAPAADSPGTVRRWVLERSGKKVEEGRWRKEELDGADEIFLTNARIGIQLVGSWRGKRMEVGGMAEGLAKAFWAESAGIEVERVVA